MKQQEAISKAKDASLATYRQMWVWIEGNDFHFDVALPKGCKLFCRIIGDEVWQWNGEALTVEHI